MEKNKIEIKNIPVDVYYSCFGRGSELEEYHISFTPKKFESFKTQLKWLNISYNETLKYLNLDKDTSVFKRFFCSDLYNQIEYLKEFEFSNFENLSNLCAISLICQIPLLYSKVSLWSYHIKTSKKIKKEKKQNTLSLKIENYTHYWTTGLTFTETDSVYQQTRNIIEKYIDFLKENNMKLSDNVIRTWFFLQNIDSDYGEFVKARREIYEKNGLTKDTHFIASTGVGGSYYDLKAKVVLDAYSISGIKNNQIEFLKAPEFLSPTYIYGVTFERGVSISYSDRKNIIISGTASINNKGEIVAPNDVSLQTERTLINIEALLKTVGADLDDVMIFIVYLRDPSDYFIVEKKLRERFKKTPIIFTKTNVCRHRWLVEIECMAISPLEKCDII